MSGGPPISTDLFRWDTLRDVGPFDRLYRVPVSGRMMEVELAEKPGVWVRVRRGADAASYFCHGLTFGGTAAPGGPVSPFSGPAVEVVLAHGYRRVDPETAARPGDIVVWHEPGTGGTPHSAIIRDPVALPGQAQLEYSTTLATKNGMVPEANETLESLVNQYGETYAVYSRVRNTAPTSGGPVP